MNKSEPVVQNFIGAMGDNWTEEEVIEEILKYFSDIPTPAHAITKLRELQNSGSPRSKENHSEGQKRL